MDVGDGEFGSLVKVWLTAAAALSYCHVVSRRLPAGPLRLLSLLPVIALFFVLPLRLSSIHFCAPTSLFLPWLANSKLLLFAAGAGPLSSPPTAASLPRFIAVASLPIKLVQNPSLKPKSDAAYPLLALRAAALAVILNLYRYRPAMHPHLALGLYCAQVYLTIELTLMLTSALARTTLGLRSEPQFNKPFLATSLQDFWGRRWNLMVSDMLRQTVYDPSLRASAPLIGRRWGLALATVVCFLVSGVFHELVLFYLTRDAKPTWEVTRFFVLMGIATAAEGAVRAAGRGTWRVHPGVAWALAMGFLGAASLGVFVPLVERAGLGVRVAREYAAASELLRDNVVVRFVCRNVLGGALLNLPDFIPVLTSAS